MIPFLNFWITFAVDDDPSAYIMVSPSTLMNSGVLAVLSVTVTVGFPIFLLNDA